MFPELRQNRSPLVREKMLVNRAQDYEIKLAEIFRQRVARRRLKKTDVFEVESFGAFAGDAQGGFDEFDARNASARKHPREDMRGRAAAAAEFENRFVSKICG